VGAGIPLDIDHVHARNRIGLICKCPARKTAGTTRRWKLVQLRDLEICHG
jgi:hypothetical protein